MKKVLILLLAAALAVLAPFSAMAETTVSEPAVLSGYASLTDYGTYYLNNTVYALDNSVIAGPFGSLRSRQDGLYYEVINENGLNKTGVIDSTGAEVLPMGYGDVIFVDDHWILGVVLESTTDVNGDYKDSSGNQYNISRVDVVYDKHVIGVLTRMEFQSASYGSVGKYLYIRTSTKDAIWLSSTFERVSVSADDFSSTEFSDVYKKGILHNPTQTYAFTADCTLQPDDVERKIWYNDDGDFVDLQGNVVSVGTFAGGKEYDSVYYYGGDYLVARTANGLRGLVNMQGEEIIAPLYDEFAGGYYDAYFALGYQAALTKEGSLVYLDEQGNELVRLDYGLTSSDYKGFAYNAPIIAVKNMGKYVVITATKGQLEETYDDVVTIQRATQRLMAVQQGEMWGVIDIDGNLVIPFIFRSAPEINGDGTAVTGTSEDHQHLLYRVSYGDNAVTDVSAETIDTADTTEPTDTTDTTEPTDTTDSTEPADTTDSTEPADTTDSTEPTDTTDSTEPVTALEEGQWGCPGCGTVNSGKFCTECGTPKPESTACSSCGYEPEEGSSPKFCPECGTPFA